MKRISILFSSFLLLVQVYAQTNPTLATSGVYTGPTFAAPNGTGYSTGGTMTASILYRDVGQSIALNTNRTTATPLTFPNTNGLSLRLNLNSTVRSCYFLGINTTAIGGASGNMAGVPPPGETPCGGAPSAFTYYPSGTQPGYPASQTNLANGIVQFYGSTSITALSSGNVSTSYTIPTLLTIQFQNSAGTAIGATLNGNIITVPFTANMRMVTYIEGQCPTGAMMTFTAGRWYGFLNLFNELHTNNTSTCMQVNYDIYTKQTNPNTTTWNGAASTSWFNHTNWDYCVPTILIDANIPVAANVCTSPTNVLGSAKSIDLPGAANAWKILNTSTTGVITVAD